MGIVKIRASRPEKRMSFAFAIDLLEEVLLLERTRGWPIAKLLELLIAGRMDSVSMTVDSPYFYFYARRTEGAISFVVQTGETRTEFEIAIATVAKRLAEGAG